VIADELILDRVVLQENVVQGFDGRMPRVRHDEMAEAETHMDMEEEMSFHNHGDMGV
jgi:hypothetical protein